MKTSFYDYCIERHMESLLTQWDSEKNDKSPKEVSHGSHYNAWWRCDKGHEWQAVVYSRGAGQKCPYCVSKRVLVGENDLASQNPELIAQWHPTRNGKLTPADVLAGSHRLVWWVCEKGHEWQATVKSRANGTGCPVCANRTLLPGVNDLATVYPQVAAQWHPTRNGELTPSMIMCGSFKKAWWICEKGHEWEATVSSRVSNGVGCPVCAGRKVVPGVNDFASAFPALAEQWDAEKNKPLTPEQVSPYSNRGVWWICEKGHSYHTAVSARSFNQSGCPYCSGRLVLAGFNDLATLEPMVAKQWHPSLNLPLTPEMVTVNSHKKVWWECPNKHVWKAVIYSRAGKQKVGCPICAGKYKKVVWMK